MTAAASSFSFFAASLFSFESLLFFTTLSRAAHPDEVSRVIVILSVLQVEEGAAYLMIPYNDARAIGSNAAGALEVL